MLETDIVDPVQFHAVFIFEEARLRQKCLSTYTTTTFFFLDAGSKSLAQAGLEFCM